MLWVYFEKGFYWFSYDEREGVGERNISRNLSFEKIQTGNL